MKYTFYNIINLLVTLFLISLVTFFVFNIIPGDPALIILGPDADINQLEILRKQLNLDLPLLQRYLIWIINVFNGNLGTSIKFNESVSYLINSRMKLTLVLTLMSIFITIIISMFFGIIIGRNKNNIIGKIIEVFCQFGLAIPTFWLGLILALVFGVIFKIFPTGGYAYSDDTSLIKLLFLPSLSIAIGNSAIIIRFLKNSIREQFNLDYVKVVRSKGFSENYILKKHILRNTFLPVITTIGIIIIDTLSGSIIIENVFSLNGIGSLTITAINFRDFPLLQGILLYISFIVVFVNFLIDLLYKIIDPRIELK